MQETLDYTYKQERNGNCKTTYRENTEERERTCTALGSGRRIEQRNKRGNGCFNPFCKLCKNRENLC